MRIASSSSISPVDVDPKDFSRILLQGGDTILALSYHVRAQLPNMNAIVIPRTWFLLPVPSTKIANILDRRNELAGNLSLEQELRYIRKINELVRERRINELVDDDPPSGNKQEYRYVEVREPIENRR